MGLFNLFNQKRKENEENNVQLLEQQMDQKIFNILQDHLPNNWVEVCFFAGYYREDSGYFKYWVKLDNGQYIDCFTLIPKPQPGEKDDLQEQLMMLHREMQSVRVKLNEKQKWVCMEMIITNQGKLSKKYDYADGVEREDLIRHVEKYKNTLNERYS